jgi:hypothetical protein
MEIGELHDLAFVSCAEWYTSCDSRHSNNTVRILLLSKI